jgi:hypothetical protein
MSLLLFFTGAQFPRSGVTRLAQYFEVSDDNWEILRREDEEILKIIKKFLNEKAD